MSKSAEVEKMARLALSRQAETDMRVDAVEAKAGEVASAAASAGGRTPPPAAASLDGLYGWRPKAFSVWFTTGGGGEVGVCYPEKCVSYGGEFVGDDALNCGVHEDPDTKFRWCEPGKPSEKLPKLVLTLVKRAEDDEGGVEDGSGVSAAGLYLYLEWVESADDAKADHGASDETVLACVPIAEYDAKLDRLSQVHVGALALGGGGGGGGGGVTPDDVSTELIPHDSAQGADNSDEGKLQIKGFKAGQPADTNTIAEYLMGTAQISGQVWLIVRGKSTGGDPVLGYVPLAAIWGDGSSGGLPLPEVTYLDDVTWDPSNHQLVKHWVKKNIVTGVETPIQGAPQGKKATIDTTPISSIIP